MAIVHRLGMQKCGSVRQCAPSRPRVQLCGFRFVYIADPGGFLLPNLAARLASGSPAYSRLVAALSWRRSSHRGWLAGSQNAATFGTRSRSAIEMQGPEG